MLTILSPNLRHGENKTDARSLILMIVLGNNFAKIVHLDVMQMDLLLEDAQLISLLDLVDCLNLLLIQNVLMKTMN